MTAVDPVETQRTDPVALGYFFVSQDARRALNGLKSHSRDLTVQPLVEPFGGRSWCLTGHVSDTSERLIITSVVERWNGIDGVRDWVDTGGS